MKTIVVFGASGGLGVKLIPLLKEKYNVIALSSKDVDISNFNQVKDFFDKNDIDIVLNMAGKKHDMFLNNISKDDYQLIGDMLNVNIVGSINVVINSLPKMIEKKYGRIIMISSVFSELNVPKNSIYSASKAFIDRLISVANKENIKFGVTCNTIQLGYWDGGMGERVEIKYQDMAKEKIGLKRFGKIEELYNTIDYIINNEYFCGQSIRIDGGL